MNDNDPRILGKQVLNQLKKYAADAGHGCEVNDECENITVGFACKHCLKKLCNDHLYFTYSNDVALKLAPICPSCIVKSHPDIFDLGYSEDDDVSEEDDEEYEETEASSEEDDIIDAEFE